MTDITLVTTFHQAGLDLYAQRFLDSFAKHVDKKIKLIAYAEECNPVNPDSAQITILSAKEVLPKLNAFKAKWGNVPKANGKCPFPEKRPRDYHKEFKWDAVRFANKIYAVLDACKRADKWCVWIDADTFVHSDWSYADFRELLPDNKWLTYVGRGKAAATWPECGFYGLNLTDKTCLAFLKELEYAYEDAENGIFQLREWHDSFVFGTILDQMKQRYPNVLDYTADMYLQTAQTGGGGHPLINTKLGQWIDHLKGGRKHAGRSKSNDIVVDHKRAYWSTQKTE